MTKTKTRSVSTNKIIFSLVFICAAIMASVFVFHKTHQPETSILASESGLIFPEPREIKSFELVSTDGKPFTLKNFYQHWTLLYFGFSHCETICPTTLALLADVYRKLSPSYPNLQIVFISLDPERDNPETLMKYTRSFDPHIIAASGKINKLRILQSQLGIYASRDPESADKNYQLQHTSSILLIDPKARWTGLLKPDMTSDQFVNALKTSMTAYHD